MLSKPEMVDSVDAFILVYRRATIENISEQLEIYMGTAHKIAFSKVSIHWVPKLLTLVWLGITLILLGKVCIQLFSHQSWVDWRSNVVL